MTDIAPASPPPYRHAMTAARFLRFLTILALVLMPIGMIPFGPAMAHTATAAMPAHCDQGGGHGERDRPAAPQPDHRADCAIACSALPAFAAEFAAPPPLRAPLQPLPQRAGRGVTHEAATPPPRLA